MNILFVHNNFPAQYKHIASLLAADPANRVAAIGCPSSQPMPNVELHQYSLSPFGTIQTHPFARRFDVECRRAEQVLYTASHIAKSGFIPDVIMVHSGWGENLALRAVFPKSRIIVYCEFYYRAFGQDVNFDPEFPAVTLDGMVGLAAKNANMLLGLVDADIGIAPTRWQRSTFPKELQPKIEVIHEGIDVDVVRPDAEAMIILPSGKAICKGDEVVTFVCRNLEPLRGFHVMMRALPKILRDRPNAEILIVGGNQISYGHAPPAGTTWKAIFVDEVAHEIDKSRVHFLGNLAYAQYLRVIQVSAVHVYLTYPFVLSWSLMEAMSAECVIVGSDVAPVQELIAEDRGLLVPFLDSAAIAAKVIEVLRAPAMFAHLGVAARRHVAAHYDAQRNCVRSLRDLMFNL